LYILAHAILLSRTNLESLADQKRSADRTLGITALGVRKKITGGTQIKKNICLGT
jgi:hypothetical protein